jgi:hypothetical protein
MRHIHLGDEVWDYRVGKSNLVIQAPNGVKRVVSFNEMAQTVLSEAQYQQWLKDSQSEHYQESITPADVKTYIEAKQDTFVRGK